MNGYDQGPGRDELIARALRELPVPDHGPTFWDDLDGRLGDAVEPAAARAAAARAADPAGHRLDTGELPSVTALAERRSRRSRRTPVLAAAAAIVILVVAVGVVASLATGGDDGGTDLADQPGDATTTLADTEATTTVGPTTTATSEALTTDTPSGTVLAWLQAIGSGDIDAAAALTGPKTTHYLTTAANGIESYITESQEGYGAWAAVPDAELTEIPLGETSTLGGSATIVIITGANRGEGRPEPITTDVFPVIDTGDGWKVEPLPFSTERDNQVIVQSPRAPTGISGLGTMAGDAAIEVIVPAAGTVLFKLDDLEPFRRDTTGVGANDDPYARYDPAGTLAGGEHTLVVVGLGDDGTVTYVAGRFTVPGGTGSTDGTTTTAASTRSTTSTTSG